MRDRLGDVFALASHMHLSACSCHDPRGALTHHDTILPHALPSRRADLEIVRELVRIRGAYRYAERHDLSRAFDELRRRIAGDGAHTLELRCWLADDTTLHLEVTVAMFGDHRDVYAWCEFLEGTAVATSFEVHARPL